MSLMRIDDLFHFEKGSLQSSKCTEGEFDFITASSEWKTHNEYTHDCEALVFAAAASGSLGRTHYVNGKFIASDLCFVITPKDPINFPIDLKFYHMIFNEFKDDIVKNTKAGTSKEAIGLKSFGNYKLPYFQIDKQVETKNQFVKMQSSKIDLNSELTHQLSLIKQLRQAFLREAMQGKLCHAELVSASQETGHDLLAKIKAEKAKLIAEKKLKKEKELPPITEDEIPFELAEHSAWCRLGDIFSVEKGLVGIQKAIDGEFPLVVTGEQRLTHNEFHFEGKAVVVPTVSSTGHGHASLKRIHYQEGKFAVGNILVCIMPLIPEYFNMKFIYNYLDTYKEFFFVDKMKGAANVSLKISSIKETPIPCIPIEIQNKYEELIVFCDDLEQSIKESQGYNEMLLQQVLREALQG
jgi:type I restriction enzyme S subunit